jgi:hypothetical protein
MIALLSIGFGRRNKRSNSADISGNLRCTSNGLDRISPQKGDFSPRLRERFYLLTNIPFNAALAIKDRRFPKKS